MELDKDIFQQFQSFLVRESGLWFAENRSELLEEKLSERKEVCGFKTYKEYLNYLQCDPEGIFELRILLDKITIGETYFFRNEPQFEVLNSYLLPKLLKEKRDKGQKSLKIWSAGCSTGEEPYTIAILVKSFLPDFEEWDVSILATDINQRSLEIAKKGIYGSRAVHAVPSSISEKYLKTTGSSYQLADEIKRMVRFEYHNLVCESFNRPEMQNVDIIFCRNVTLYFNLETVKKVISKFSEVLLPGGHLFIGHAETLWQISNDFHPIEFPQTFIYQKLLNPEAELVTPPPILLPSIFPLKNNTREKIRPKMVVHPIEKLMNLATDLANQGEYSQALNHVRQVISRDTLHTAAYYLMGVLLTKKKEYEKAIETFQRVLYLENRAAIIYFHLGNLYRFLGKKQEAKKKYENCLKILQEIKGEEKLLFSEGLTAGVLYQAALHALEVLP